MDCVGGLERGVKLLAFAISFLYCIGDDSWKVSGILLNLSQLIR